MLEQLHSRQLFHASFSSTGFGRGECGLLETRNRFVSRFAISPARGGRAGGIGVLTGRINTDRRYSAPAC